MNLTDTYIECINKKREKENLKQEILFGQGTGAVITIVAFLQFLSTTNVIVEYIMKFLMLLGISLFTAGVAFPYILYYPSKGLEKIINKIFQLLFQVILVVIYFLFILPVGLICRKKWASQYGFFCWDSNTEIIESKGFVKRENMAEVDKESQKRDNKFKNVIKIIGYFKERKQFVLIPILCVLILLGFLFFFITSGVVTPMIYTLF